MIGLSFNQIFENTMHYQHHMRKLVSARSAIDASRPKSKLKCTKQALSQFHRVYQVQLENKHLYFKITNPHSSVQNQLQNRKLIKNNRKQYYQEYERSLQNSGLLRRIKSAKTSYNAKKLLSQRKSNQQYIQTISKFGYTQKKKNPFEQKIKMITQNSQALTETFRSSRTSKAQLRNSMARQTKGSQQNHFKVFKDKSNNLKNYHQINSYLNVINDKKMHVQRE